MITAEKARARDAAGRAGAKNVDYYPIVFGDPQLPDACIEVVWENNDLAVWFVDDDGSRLIEFGFRKVSEQQMFVSTLTRWQYPTGARATFSDAELVESISYTQDGMVKHRLNHVHEGRTTCTDYKEVDVSET